jgi:hypothetical protein
MGGFDPLFFMYGEDDDLIARFAHHDIPFALVTYSRVVHLRAKAAPPETISAWRKFDRAVDASRSTLIALIKRPTYGVGHMVLSLITHGLLRPFSDFLVERDSTALMSTMLATFKVMGELPRIWRHARLCGQAGPHFLELNNLQGTKRFTDGHAVAKRLDDG